MAEYAAVIIELDDTTRELSTSCDHGAIVVRDAGSLWSDEQLADFAWSVLSARAGCSCPGVRSWFPPRRPSHITVEEVRLYEPEVPDPDIDTARPRVIPGRAVSLAASRVFETRRPDDHSLDADWRLLRWYWTQRQAGALRDD